MINLLANERKDEIRAARVNILLVRYTAIITMGFLFIGAALFVSHTVLMMTMANAESIIKDNDVKANIYAVSTEQINGLATKLNDAKASLNQEAHYSQLLVKLGQQMPPGTIMGDITITSANFGGKPTEFKVYAKSRTEASLVQATFQKSSVFVQPVSIKSPEDSQEVTGYPVVISVSAKFNKGGM